MLLKPHPKALVAFNCLLNTGNWDGGLFDGKTALNHYLFTYVAMGDLQSSIFNLRSKFHCF